MHLKKESNEDTNEKMEFVESSSQKEKLKNLHVQESREQFILLDQLPGSSNEHICEEEDIIPETEKTKHRLKAKVPLLPKLKESTKEPSDDAHKNKKYSQCEDAEGQNSSIRISQEKFILPDPLSESSNEDICEEEGVVPETEKTKHQSKVKDPLSPKEKEEATENEQNSNFEDVERQNAFVRRLQEKFILPDQLLDISATICKGEDIFPITEPIKHRAKTKPRPPPKEKFQCSVCSLKFTRKYQLKRHMQMTPCSGLPTPGHTCEYCGKVYRRKDNLTVHLRTHTGGPKYIRKMNHTCSYCGKQYHHIATLVIHVRKHTGEKPFPCDLCEKRFPSNGQLTVHWRKHTGEKPYACKECGQRFAQNSSLKRHMLRKCSIPTPCILKLASETFQTDENELTNKNVSNDDSSASASEHNEQSDCFSCNRCRKNFNSTETLQQHICTVLEANCNFGGIKKDLKPYQCTICFKRFTRKNALNVHILTHNSEKSSSCDQCGKDFLRKDSLVRHMKRTYCKCESILPD